MRGITKSVAGAALVAALAIGVAGCVRAPAAADTGRDALLAWATREAAPATRARSRGRRSRQASATSPATSR